jgi:hypothetical protein
LLRRAFSLEFGSLTLRVVMISLRISFLAGDDKHVRVFWRCLPN